MIQVTDLVKRYGGDPVLDGVSLEIPEGSFVVIAGRNGAGKTTLVRHFNALSEPDEGTVTVDDEDVSKNPVVARTTVGMVFQQPRDQFVAARAGDDVAFGPENLGLDRTTIDRRVEEALSAVGLEGETERRIETLSGGQQARVAIAGALAMDPAYLVLDEPFASLDHPSRQTLLEHLDAIHAAETAVIAVTHDLRDLCARADRVIGLDGGRVAVDTDDGDEIADLDSIGVRVPRYCANGESP